MVSVPVGGSGWLDVWVRLDEGEWVRSRVGNRMAQARIGRLCAAQPTRKQYTPYAPGLDAERGEAPGSRRWSTDAERSSRAMRGAAYSAGRSAEPATGPLQRHPKRDRRVQIPTPHPTIPSPHSNLSTSMAKHQWRTMAI